MSTPCSCCFTDTLAKCETHIKLNIILPVYGSYRWVITDKNGNKNQGDLNAEQTIPVADLPTGMVTQYSGLFTLEIFEQGDAACLPVQFLVAGKYTCIEFGITGGNFEKNNLGCEIEASTDPDTLIDNYVALLTQTGTDDPVATVYNNEVPVTWVRSGSGTFTGTFAGTYGLILFFDNITLIRTGAQEVTISTPDGALNNTPVKMEFYI